MDLPQYKFPGSPGAPLLPLSPERVNSARSPFDSSEKQLPFSPSLPDFRGLEPSHQRSGSDAHVQGMVARFNNLHIKDSRRDEVAYKRSEMAREMAELELKKVREEKAEIERHAGKYREEARRLRKDIEEGRERERKVAKRIDVLMDEMHRSKESTSQTQAVYEKEIRRARKEAFKSSSQLVKVQEELKATRSSLKVTQSGLESERAKLSRREQEAFTAKYQLVAVQEALEKAQMAIKVVEEERDALKTSLKEEEIARIAAEGGIALPPSHSQEDEDDEFASPRKAVFRRPVTDSEDKENVMPRRAMELKAIQEELQREVSLRARAEEQIDFMKMECQFRCCSCRIADIQSTTYVHDNSMATEMERIKATVPALLFAASDDECEEPMEGILEEQLNSISVASPVDFEPMTAIDDTQAGVRVKDEIQNDEVVLENVPPVESNLSENIIPSETTPTEETMDLVESEPAEFPFRPIHPLRHQLSRITEAAVESSPVANVIPAKGPAAESPESAPKFLLSPKIRSVEDDEGNKENLPETPAPAIRTITTTTTIPLQFSPAPFGNMPPTPSTISHLPARSNSAHTPSSNESITLDLGKVEIDRAAALEAIRQRRGRARSIANAQMTPRKQMLEGVTGGRRDISAPNPTMRYGRT